MSRSTIDYDVNTDQLNIPGSGVQGLDASNFVFTLSAPITASKMRIVNFRYTNQTLGPTVLPIMTCSLVKKTGINNNITSLLYISEEPANNTNYIIRNESNNSVFVYEIINKDYIKTIDFQVQRSDNGASLPLADLRFYIEFIE